MDKSQIAKELDNLSALYDELAQAQQDQQAEIDALIPADIRTKVDDVRLKYAQHLTLLFAKIQALEKLVKAEGLKVGSTVSGKTLRAAFRRGTLRWDTKKLMEYSKTDYRVLAFRTRGKPSVKIEKL